MSENNYSFCPYCGKKLAQLSRFCPKCGKQIIENSNTEAVENAESKEDIPYIASSVNDANVSDSVSAEAAVTTDNAVSATSAFNSFKVYIDKKYVITGIVSIIMIILIIMISCMFAGIIDGTKIGIVNKEKALANVEQYIAAGEYEKASDYAVAAQKAKSKDTEFLKSLVYAINPICPLKAYDMAANYANKKGNENIDTDVKKWLEIGQSVPTRPEVIPGGGTYIYAPEVQLRDGIGLIGHGVYYTTDGSEPDTNSSLYYGSIKITGDCTLKLIAVNGKREKTDTVTQIYEIDGNMQKRIDETLSKANSVLENSVAGDEVGQCLQSCKDNLQKTVDVSLETLKKSGNTLDIGEKICNDINNSVAALEDSIITDVDKTALNSSIEKANSLYTDNVNGTYSLYLQNDLGILKNKIGQAEALVNSRNPKQEELDNANNEINDAVSTFNYAINTVKADIKYNKFKGYYSYYHDHTGDRLNVFLSIDKVSGGKLYGSFHINHLTLENDGRIKDVYSEKELNGIPVNNGKIAFDISGTSSYRDYGYEDEYVPNQTETKEYTSGVTVNLVEDGIIQVAMTNIGNTVDFNETLYRD